jgi:outer membrane PBP1 activator LpoA protein
MHRFSAIVNRSSISWLALVAFAALAVATEVAAQTPQATSNAANANAVATTKIKRIVLLLPTEQPMLRRAALAVRDGIRAAATNTGEAVELRDCSYGADSVVAAYRRCVVEETDAVIGPLGRSEVAALVGAHANLALVKPTLMLSPLEATPPKDFLLIAPDLESEAQAIARQSLEDACRKPLLVEMPGQIHSRVAATILRHYKSIGVATPLAQQELGTRESWQKRAEVWRRDAVDCVLFAGSGAMVYELRPYLRGATLYITSSGYETALDDWVDWSGIRIADAPFVLDRGRADFVGIAPPEITSPTLLRLFALGLDAARLVVSGINRRDPNSEEALLALRDPKEGRGDGTEAPFKPIQSFEGAIGTLALQDGRYLRTPAVGEFRGRTPVLRGF